jgi:hypothetical protein
MPIASVIFLMVLLLATGKRSKAFGLGQILMVLFVTMIQICILILYMYTMEKPPLY